MSTVVFDVDRILLGESPSTLEFIATGSSERLTRDLGDRFVVALKVYEQPIFLPDVRYWDDLNQLFLFKTDCGNYMFPMDGTNTLSARFLIEVFDGDGDPAEEAAVFDRFLRGSGLF